MNSVYRYYKKELNGEVRLSDPRLMRLFKLERLMKNKYLPIDSEENCHEALRAIVHDVRMELVIMIQKTNYLIVVCFNYVKLCFLALVIDNC